MALESALYPTQLIATNPTGADVKGQGDDHIRMLKRVFQATFPNINSPVTVTPAQLNQLASPDLFVRAGMIVIWGGAYESIPSGWLLCNGVGTTSNGHPVPDLRDRFVGGAGLSWPNRTTGGSYGHVHAASVDVIPHAITLNEMPFHNHTVQVATQGLSLAASAIPVHNGDSPPNHKMPGFAAPYANGGGMGAGYTYANVDGRTGDVLVQYNGAGQAHDHAANFAMDSAFNIPPFMAMAYIIKY